MCLGADGKWYVLTYVSEISTWRLSYKEILGEAPLKSNKWMTFLTTIDDVKLQVYRFKDLQTKDIILACTSVVLRNPRQTKHTGTVPSVQLSC